MTPSSPFPSAPAANELPMPPRALLRGTQVERFEILRVIADAASNLEYVAIDPADQTEVVLKEYMPQRLGRRKGNHLRPLTPSASVPLSLGLRAFIEEGRMLAGIDHPALVRVLGMIEANGTAYMVMPLYDGLRVQHARLSMNVPPDEHLLRPLLGGLLSALEAMHGRGLIHGAVSPGSVLLLSDERAVLLGPDLARRVIADDLVESLMTAVEPTFEAPEQLAPSPATPTGPWTDLYSLAETMRFCISGELRMPYSKPGARRESMAQMVRRLFGQPPTAVYSTALLDTLDASLNPDPAARPQSTTRFREMLGPEPSEAVHAAPTAVAGATAAPVSTNGVPPTSPGASPVAPPVSPASDSFAASVAAAVADVISDTHGGRVEPAFDASDDAPALAPPTIPARERAARSAERPAAGRRIPLRIAAAVALCAFAAYWAGPWSGGGHDSTPVAITTPAPAPAPTAPDSPFNELPGTARAPTSVDPAPPAAAPMPMPMPTPTPAPTRAPATAPAPAPATRPAFTAGPRSTPAPRGPSSPRDVCENRTDFALYRCMQLQCEQRVWLHHPQCELLRETDKVPP